MTGVDRQLLARLLDAEQERLESSRDGALARGQEWSARCDQRMIDWIVHLRIQIKHTPDEAPPARPTPKLVIKKKESP